ncbi:hypothetical protein Leryth_010908 [Lithospermum erythrorhizon]|nr:hypothetical protein Leryth_010908 [Lithospermum erythrorhizon]
MHAMQKASNIIHKTLRKTLSFHFSTSSSSKLPNSPPPSSAYYDELIDFAARNRDFTTVQHLLNKRAKDGCFNTTNTFKFIATNDPANLQQVMQCLNNLDGGLARKGSYNALIAQLSKLDRIREAMVVVHEMVKKDYGAKATSFHPILNALTKRREMGEAWSVLELMRERGISPDTTSYNYLLTSYCFIGDLESSCLVLRKMREVGLEEDLRTYDSLVLGACRWGKLQGALMILRRMVYVGLSPLYATYAHVINAMCRDGFYHQAVELVRCYAGRDSKLDFDNFGLLATRLLKLKRFDEAKIVVEEMENRNIPINDSLRCVFNPPNFGL